MAEQLRFAIIGCGVIGPTHAEAIAGLPDATLVAVADVLPERADTLAVKYGVKSFDNAAEMLAREQPDVVCVCTPSGMHGAHAVLAMRAGAHVIVEKPMEITRPAMDQMLRVQEEMGVKMAVISQHRFDPASMQVHDLVTEGALGTLVMGVASIPWWRSQAYYDSGAWRGTWALDGGGVLMNQGIHSIDLLQWLMGPVRSLTAYTQTRVHRMETEDVAVAILRFAGGALGAITGTTGAYPGVTTRIDVYGDRGSAVIENDRLGFLRLARDAMEEAGAYGIAPGERATAAGSGVQDPRAVPANTHALQIADMVAAIREDRPPLLDGQGARRAVDIILAIYESARSGREVDVP